MKIELDTEKMRESAKDIMSLANELTVVFDDMFDKLSSVSKQGVWIGEAADEYSYRVNIEKNDYVNFSKILYQYGKVLNDTANEYDQQIKDLEYKK